MNIIHWFLCGIFGLVFGSLHAATSKKLQDIHKEIGDKLISLRKEYPQAQQHVYSVLDHVGKLHAQAQELSQNQLLLEQKLEGKDAAYKAVSDELVGLKSKFTQARNEVKQISEKLAVYQAEQEKKNAEKKAGEERPEQVAALSSPELDFKNKLLSKMNKKNELNQ